MFLNNNNSLYDEQEINYTSTINNLTKQQIEEHPLYHLYFANDNIKRIQKQIKKEVFLRTKGIFILEVDQDETDLLIAMKAVYFEYAKFLPTDLYKQLHKLNKTTIDYILPNIITEIKQEYSYLLEINGPIKPIPRPINVHSGKQILPAMTTLL